MKTVVLPHALVLVLFSATLAGAQATAVSGRVTTEAGVSIKDAHVYVFGAVLGRKPDGEAIVETAETRTSANGSYTLKIPFPAISNSGYHELRVRAQGYEPQTHTVLAGATLVDENVRLKADTYRGDTVRVVRVFGKVSTEAGVGIAGAEVYLADHRIMVATNAAGEYRFDAPAANGLRSVRARAVGYVPGVEGIYLSPGSQRNVEINFKLKGDPNGPWNENPVATKTFGTTTKTVPSRAPVTKMSTEAAARRDSIRVVGTEPARYPFSEARVSTSRGQPAVVPIQADPFGRHLFTAEQVMQHQNALGLQDSQRAELQKAVESAQSQTLRLQWALAQETEKLSTQLSAETLDEKEVLTQTDRIFAIEREIKRAQMTLMIKIKNTLTAEQHSRLRQLR